jgi:hypothetical protein
MMSHRTLAGGEEAHPRTLSSSVIAVRFRASAQRDVQQAFELFEARSAGLGAEFLERVEQATQPLSHNSERRRFRGRR